MVERFEFTCPDCDPDTVAVNHGRYVRHSDYEALERDNAELLEKVESHELTTGAWVEKHSTEYLARIAAERRNAELEAAQERMRSLVERAQHIVPHMYVNWHSAARAALTGSGGWRDISDCPAKKDVCYLGFENGSYFIFWVGEHEGERRYYLDEPDGYYRRHPTHWMPLAAAPEAIRSLLKEPEGDG